MFGSQIVLNICLSLLFFVGLLGENVIFAFIYPIFVFAYLLVDVFLTILSTDLILHVFKKGKACVVSIILRDFIIIALWLCFLLYIGVNVITIYGTLFYAFPKVTKIIICDIINRQKYLHQFIDI